jgi:hypothetical protein
MSYKKYTKEDWLKRLDLLTVLENAYANLNYFYNEYIIGDDYFEDDRIRISELLLSIEREIDRQQEKLNHKI